MQKITDNILVLIILGIGSTLLMGIALILLYIRNQNRFLRQQQQAQQAEINHQKQLLSTVIQSQEAERKRIGQDLHDDVGSALSSLRLTLDMYQPPATENTGYQSFNQNCKGIIDQIITDVRHISHNLSPSMLSLYGLNAALDKQLDYINLSKGMTATLHNEVPDLIGQLDLTAATALYRVLEELLNNTLKHAGASQIDIRFHIIAEDLIINYHDNGKGLPAGPAVPTGIGLQNIESRLIMLNAGFTVGPPAARGFNFTIRYPLPSAVIHQAV